MIREIIRLSDYVEEMKKGFVKAKENELFISADEVIVMLDNIENMLVAAGNRSKDQDDKFNELILMADKIKSSMQKN
jgi:hypothetical protein